MIFRYFILLFSFFAFQTINAQQPVSIHLTEKDGLPDIEFYDILEDNEGFIWLAADKGLYRYDGKYYELFTNPEKRGRSLFGLTLDQKGRVWSNNLSGQFFYTEGEELKLFKDFENINTLVDFNIYNNHLIIKKIKNIEIVDIETKVTVSELDNRNEAYLVDLNANKDGFYFNRNNIIHFTNDVTFNKSYPQNSTPIATEKMRGYRKFFEFENRIFYFAQLESTRKSRLYSIVETKLIQYTIPKILEYAIVVHSYEINGKLWVLTNNGIFICAIKNKYLSVEEHYFKGLFTTDVLIDKNQNFWVTTLKNGVFVMPNSELKKIKLPKDVGVNTIEKTTNNELFLATSNHEIFSYNNNNNLLNKTAIEFKNNVSSISYNNIVEDLLMVSTTESVVYNRTHKTIKKGKLVSTKSIAVINEDEYLVSMPHALSVYSKTKDTVSVLRNFRSYGSVINSYRDLAYCNFIDGLGIYNLQTNNYKQIQHNNKPVFASRIAIDDEDIVWVATDGKGVYGFKNDVLTHTLTTKNGLLSHLINVIKPDGNTLWISTDKGLQNYNYRTQKITTINREDGVDSYNITAIEILDDDVFFSSNTGLYKFNKKKILKTRITLQPYFTTVSIQEKDTILKSNYKLKQTESEIRIGFNTNGFQSNNFVNYEYQLEGLNSKWVDVESGLDFVKFNTLPAGKFKFNLRAKNRFQNSYSKLICIGLTVRLPFYKTWWFYLLVLLLSLVFIWMYFSKKTKRLNANQKQALEKAKMNQQLVFSQLENLRSQMNPHFIFNALNSIQDYIILNEKKLARVYLVKF
ncbi:histidine kinase, partial [Lacinutrix sp.]|uniref:histidine kinase n=1 Tax=Lacinutrix sp. TaxID=1937692 RepID=UPI0025C0516F